jgi:hypothetical protein
VTLTSKNVAAFAAWGFDWRLSKSAERANQRASFNLTLRF